MNDLQTALWWVLALYSTTATRKPLDYLQNVLFRKISRDKWVNSCEATVTVLFFTAFLHFAETVILKVCHLNGCIHLNKIERIKKDGSLCSPSDPCQNNGWHLWLPLIQLHGNATGNWLTPIPQWHPWSDEIQKSPLLGLDTLNRHNFGHNALVRASSIMATFFSIMWMIMKKY